MILTPHPNAPSTALRTCTSHLHTQVVLVAIAPPIVQTEGVIPASAANHYQATHRQPIKAVQAWERLCIPISRKMGAILAGRNRDPIPLIIARVAMRGLGCPKTLPGVLARRRGDLKAFLPLQCASILPAPACQAHTPPGECAYWCVWGGGGGGAWQEVCGGTDANGLFSTWPWARCVSAWCTAFSGPPAQPGPSA